MIIPAILEQDIEEVKRKVSLVEEAANLIHVDVVDGKQVYGTTLLDFSGLEDFETSCVFEIHLMVADPLKYLEPKLKRVIKICSQIEVSPHTVKEFIKTAKKLEYKVGLSLKEETPLKDLKQYIEDLDYVQLLSVEPGAQGRSFDKDIFDKVRHLRKEYPHLYIQVDGGIDEENLIKLLNVGVNGAVIGSHIFESPSPEETVRKFRKISEDYAN